jgi:hypothetical protein
MSENYCQQEKNSPDRINYPAASGVVWDKGKEAPQGARYLTPTRIKEIIALEWLMFDKVENVSGRAGCQDDLASFVIMRAGQFLAWDDATLSCYLEDLKAAKSSGRNPVAEKYGYMMENSSPAEYAAIRHMLPAVSGKKKNMIDGIAAIALSWQEEAAARYPRVLSGGRPISARYDRPGEVSFETYLRGELATYSEKTLRAYLAHIGALLREGRNMALMILENTVRASGFDSLEAAEIASARMYADI